MKQFISVDQLLFCLYAFTKTLQPSSPFLFIFMGLKNLTHTQIYEEILPVWNYSYFAFLIPLGVLSELLGHKYVILLTTALDLASNLILIFGNSMDLMIVDQVTSGMGFAGFVVFSSYVYTVVSKERYQQTTSIVRGSYLAGSVFSSLLGQLLYTYFKLPLEILFYISVGVNSVCVLLVVFFPHPVDKQTVSGLYKNIIALPGKVYHSYSQLSILQLSIWSQVVLMTHHIVLLFWQSLFSTLPGPSWNGIISAVAYSFAALLALSPILYERRLTTLSLSLVFQSMFPMLLAGFLLCMALYANFYSMASMFVMYHSLYELAYVVTMAAIAKKMKAQEDEHFALIFSLNAFIGNFYQVVYLIVTGPRVLGLSVQVSFVCLGAIMALLGIVYFVAVILVRLCCPHQTPVATLGDVSDSSQLAYGSASSLNSSAYFASINANYLADATPFDPLSPDFAKDSSTEKIGRAHV